MTDTTPAWRKAWKVDDPEWMKNRQMEWKKLKSSVVFKDYFNTEEVSEIKNFFLFGRAHDPEPEQEDWRWLRYHPNKKPISVSYSALIQAWLSPVFDPSRWKEIIKDTDLMIIQRNRNFMRNTLRSDYPDTGNLFGEREKLLYHIFEPTRINYEDIPSDRLFNVAKNVFLNFSPVVSKFFNLEFNPDNLAPELLPEYCDSLIPYCEQLEDDEFHELRPVAVAKVIQKPLEILTNPDDYHPDQVKAAQYIIDRLNDEDLEPKHLSPIKNAISDAGFARK